MSDEQIIDHETHAPVITPAQLDGVRTGRVFGFFIDYLIVAALCIPFAIVIGILGVVTFGLAWGLYAILPFIVAIIYLAVTMGGSQQSTIGMRMMGIKIKRLDGKKIDPLLAALHGILFWVIHSIAVILPLFVTFFSSRKRLLHDILLGTYVVRA